MPYIAVISGFIGGFAAFLLAWYFMELRTRPRVSIDNRIFYAPLEMRYSYCIKITNKSSRYYLYDLEFSGDIVCRQEKQAPALQIWALPDACLRPSESRMYYLSLLPNDTSAPKVPALPGPEEADFRKVFQMAKDAELQVLLKCRHGSSGQTRLFHKRFLKKDFYNHMKLEA